MSTAPLAPAGALARLLGEVAALGVPHGIEDSLKFSARDGLVAQRLLVGVRCADLPWPAAEALLTRLGLPAAHRGGLQAAYDQANALGLAVEDRGHGTVWKVYLEFWDAVRAALRAGTARTPQRMHLGLKWTEGPDPRVDEAHYTCHPLLAHDEILARLTALYGTLDTPGRRATRRLVKACARQAPRAPLIYLEAAEAGNPRRSFDLNFYRTGLVMADARTELQTAGEAMGIAADALAQALDPLGPARLGHLSGGVDRHGHDFLSVYAERQPL